MVVSVGIDFWEKLVEVVERGPSIEDPSVLETTSQPCFELASFQSIISIDVMTQEHIFNEGSAVDVHCFS